MATSILPLQLSITTFPAAAAAPDSLRRLALDRPLERWDENSLKTTKIPMDVIKLRAYYKYIARGAIDGFDCEDWYEAELEERTRLRQIIASLREQHASDFRPDGIKGVVSVAEYPRIIGGQQNSSETQLNAWDSKRLDDRTTPGRVGSFKEGRLKMTQHETQGSATEKCLAAGEGLKGYRDALTSMRADELARLKDKVLAISTETGQIIAVADSAAELREMVRRSAFSNRPWRRAMGPSSKGPLPLDELALPPDAAQPTDAT